MGFLRFVHENKLPVSVASMKHWSAHLQENGIASTRVGWALSMFTIIAAAYDITVPSSDYALITKRIHLHDRAYKRRDQAKLRYGLTREDILSLLGNHPKNTPSDTWDFFVTLGWTFLLRSEEIKKILPQHLLFLKGPNNVDGVQLRVAGNKNSINKKEEKLVFFPLNEIPDQLIPILRKFKSLTNFSWKHLSSNNAIIRHLRKYISPPSSNYEIVVHSFRHGRPGEIKFYGYCNVKLAKVGRWHSSSSVQRYSHM